MDVELLPGCADAAGTRRFADRFPELPNHFRCPDQLWLGSIGLGMRNGEPGGGDDFAYREAIHAALERGVNVFDTALSYRMQTSERALGAALGRCIQSGAIQRDEVYVITKGGYITVDYARVTTNQEARRYLHEAYVESGLIDLEFVVNGNHSFEARFLRDQIARSRNNLGLEAIDLYCLQDPELQLVAHGPTTFRRLLCRAFEALEGAVSDGLIRAYGLSTWSGLLMPYTEKGHLSISELFEVALEVGGADHHLRGLQLPYNVAMGEAMGLPSQFGPGSTGTALLESICDTGTAVFAIAPLVQGRATSGLPRFLATAFPEATSDPQRALQFVRSSPGVTAAIVGMRQESHVAENLGLARNEPARLDVIESLYERVAAE